MHTCIYSIKKYKKQLCEEILIYPFRKSSHLYTYFNKLLVNFYSENGAFQEFVKAISNRFSVTFS